MSFRQQVDDSSVTTVVKACVATGTLVAGIIIFIYQMVLYNHDLVEKDTYTLNTKLNESWVPKKQYDDLLYTSTVVKDKPLIPVVSNLVRKIKIINNDSVDLYAIRIYESDIISDYAVSIRDTLKNKGFANTEIFLSQNNKYYVMVYGFACIGRGISRVEKIVRKILKKKECAIECIDLTTYSGEGFVDCRINTIFQYYTPRKVVSN